METQAMRIGRKVSQLSADGLYDVEEHVDFLLEAECKMVSVRVPAFKPHRSRPAYLDEFSGEYWYERNRTVRKWYD